MKIYKKIEKHCSEKQFCKIVRKIEENRTIITNGYIIDYSNNLVLMQVVNDFIIDGFVIFPIDTIKKIRFNKNDQFYEQILIAEGITDKINRNISIDLTDWASALSSIEKLGHNVIVENERFSDNYFLIGTLEEIHPKKAFLRYFDAQGILEDSLSKFKYSTITIVKFDDIYSRTFSKYIRRRDGHQ